MLREIPNVAQKKDDPGHRRWFSDEDLDLIVWYSTSNHITGFQLCYDKETREHAITWKFDSGFEHDKINSGDSCSGGSHKGAPILVAAKGFPQEKAIVKFKEKAAKLEFEIVNFIIKKLEAYNPINL